MRLEAAAHERGGEPAGAGVVFQGEHRFGQLCGVAGFGAPSDPVPHNQVLDSGEARGDHRQAACQVLREAARRLEEVAEVVIGVQKDTGVRAGGVLQHGSVVQPGQSDDAAGHAQLAQKPRGARLGAAIRPAAHNQPEPLRQAGERFEELGNHAPRVEAAVQAQEEGIVAPARHFAAAFLGPWRDRPSDAQVRRRDKNGTPQPVGGPHDIPSVELMAHHQVALARQQPFERGPDGVRDRIVVIGIVIDQALAEQRPQEDQSGAPAEALGMQVDEAIGAEAGPEQFPEQGVLGNQTVLAPGEGEGSAFPMRPQNVPDQAAFAGRRHGGDMPPGLLQGPGNPLGVRGRIRVHRGDEENATVWGGGVGHVKTPGGRAEKIAWLGGEAAYPRTFLRSSACGRARLGRNFPVDAVLRSR